MAPPVGEGGEPTDVAVNDVAFTVKINTVFFKQLSDTFCTFEWWNAAHEFVEPIVTEKLDAWQGDPDEDRNTVNAEWYDFKKWFHNAFTTFSHVFYVKFLFYQATFTKF